MVRSARGLACLGSWDPLQGGGNPVTTGTALLVVGGGPAGVTAALQARELGAEVTLLEAGHVGGTSLNRGPAPVRTLARAARLARDWTSWAGFGLEGPRSGAAPAGHFGQRRAGCSLRPREEAHVRPSPPPWHRSGRPAGPGSLPRPAHLERRRRSQLAGPAHHLAVGGHAARLPIPGQELALTYEDISTPHRPAGCGGGDRRGRHGLSDCIHPRRPRASMSHCSKPVPPWSPTWTSASPPN